MTEYRPDRDDTAPITTPLGATLPPTQHFPVQAAPQRGGRGLAAAVLAGALVLGGGAGYVGAAIHDSGQESGQVAQSSDAPAPVTASNASAKAGSVEQVAAKVLPSVVKINVTGQDEAGSGSGIVLDDKGHILTNNHVVAVAQGGGSITVNFNDGQTVKAKVVGTDPITDIAVIKVSGAKDLHPATIGSSDSLKVGQAVVAVGSPFGLNSTVTSGIVSALNRAVSVQREDPQPQQTDPFGFPQIPVPQSSGQDLSTTYPAIQTDAAINPGNSGGPLVDLAGRVVGINSSIRTAGSDGSEQGGSIGLGFAIPIDEVLPIVNQLIAGQHPTHARMAVTVTDVGGSTLAQGALIKEVEKGGPADQAGLQAGDVVTRVDSLPIDGSESLVATIRGHRPGDKVTITYLRDKDTHTATVTLESDASTTKS